MTDTLTGAATGRVTDMGAIHALSVGGGILAIAPLPGAGGDYAADLGHVLNWTPALVLSLTTEAEMVAAGAARLGPELQERATRWMHLPVAMGAAPSAAVAERWTKARGIARGALWGGGRVLIHGRRGAGRAGMAALRLMIEAGEAPDEALERLRHVHPRAIETEAQMAWALAARREAAVFVRARA